MCCGSVQHRVVSRILSCLQERLGDFQSLDSFKRVSFVLGSDFWEDKFGSLFDLVKGHVGAKKGYLAVIPAFNCLSLRLCLGNCRVTLVEG